MPRYGVGQARARLAALLDAAERGEPSIIERRGVRFRLEALPLPSRRRRGRPLLEFVDPVVAAGQWTWNREKGGLRFSARTKRPA